MFFFLRGPHLKGPPPSFFPLPLLSFGQSRHTFPSVVLQRFLPSCRCFEPRCLAVNSHPSCLGNVIQAEARAAVGGRNRRKKNNIFTALTASFFIRVSEVQVPHLRYQHHQQQQQPPITNRSLNAHLALGLILKKKEKKRKNPCQTCE